MELQNQVNKKWAPYIRGWENGGSFDGPTCISQLIGEIERLHALVHNAHTESFLEGTRLEAAYQVAKWGEAQKRGKSAEAWFWLVDTSPARPCARRSPATRRRLCTTRSAAPPPC